jgi:hypothetical protein
MKRIPSQLVSIGTGRVGVFLDFEMSKVTFSIARSGQRSILDIPPGLVKASPYLSTTGKFQSSFFFSPDLWSSPIQVDCLLIENSILPVHNEDWKKLEKMKYDKNKREDSVPFNQVLKCAQNSNPLFQAVLNSVPSLQLNEFEFSTKFQMFLLGSFIDYADKSAQPTEEDFVNRTSLLENGARDALRKLLEENQLMKLISFDDLWAYFVCWVRRSLSICEKYMAIMRMPDEPMAKRVAKYGKLRELFSQFYEQAEKVARTIALELGNDPSQQTYKPSSMGGIAGGKKYVVK